MLLIYFLNFKKGMEQKINELKFSPLLPPHIFNKFDIFRWGENFITVSLLLIYYEKMQVRLHYKGEQCVSNWTFFLKENISLLYFFRFCILVYVIKYILKIALKTHLRLDINVIYTRSRLQFCFISFKFFSEILLKIKSAIICFIVYLIFILNRWINEQLFTIDKGDKGYNLWENGNLLFKFMHKNNAALTLLKSHFLMES